MQVDENLKLAGGIIRIVVNNSAKTIYGERMTLKECFDTAKTISTVPVGCVIVMHEEATRGVVYRYGEHGAIWERSGTLVGFA